MKELQQCPLPHLFSSKEHGIEAKKQEAPKYGSKETVCLYAKDYNILREVVGTNLDSELRYPNQQDAKQKNGSK